MWVLGSVGCAVAPRFWVLILCRVVMGAGEASIITLSNPFIDDVAPPAQKTLWFGILNLVRSYFTLCVCPGGTWAANPCSLQHLNCFEQALAGSASKLHQRV